MGGSDTPPPRFPTFPGALVFFKSKIQVKIFVARCCGEGVDPSRPSRPVQRSHKIPPLPSRSGWAAALGLLGAALLLWGTATTAPAVRQALAAPASSTGAARTLPPVAPMTPSPLCAFGWCCGMGRQNCSAETAGNGKDLLGGPALTADVCSVWSARLTGPGHRRPSRSSTTLSTVVPGVAPVVCSPWGGHQTPLGASQLFHICVIKVVHLNDWQS